MLDKLTIVILSYNRHKYLNRAINYWLNLGPKVHIVDGSPSQLNTTELINKTSRVEYHHLPAGFYERLTYAVSLVNTEFCALISDDEFFLTSGLIAAIEYLDKQKDYLACGGQVIRFLPLDNQIFWRNDYPLFRGYSVCDADPFERMIFHMKYYSPSMIYAVCRSEEWKKAIRIVTRKEYSVYAIGELQFEIAMSYMGKSAVLNNIFWLRSDENKAIRGTDLSLDVTKPFSEWWNNNPLEKDHLLESMSMTLSNYNKISSQKIKDVINYALNEYYLNNIKNSKQIENFNKKLYTAIKWRLERLIMPRSYSPGGVWLRILDLLHSYEGSIGINSNEKSEVLQINKILNKFHNF